MTARTPAARLRRAAALLLPGALALTLSAGLALPSAGAAEPTEPAPEPAPSGPTYPVEVLPEVRMVAANLYVGLSPERFQADARQVIAEQPDFVAYNEVQGRYDHFLAPTGYALHRSPENRYTMATPVAWRTDRWTMVDSGTHWISKWRGVPPGKKIELGRRAANWVTLQGVDGRTVSVVSAHVAPPTKGMPDLLRRSVRNLTVLVDQLALRGPVVVGGDFNVHYTSGRYPRDLLTAAGLVPTYDTLANHFGTGDKYGHTIDYVFVRNGATTTPVAHRPAELRSDHDAVVADLGWTVDAPASVTSVVSDPSATDAATKRAAVSRLRAVLAAAQPGQSVQVFTQELALRSVRRSLTLAAERGVQVQVVVPGSAASPRQSISWVRRCVDPCTTEGTLVPTLVLVSDADGTPLVRLDSGRPLTSAMLEQPTRVTTSTGRFALGEAWHTLSTLG